MNTHFIDIYFRSHFGSRHFYLGKLHWGSDKHDDPCGAHFCSICRASTLGPADVPARKPCDAGRGPRDGFLGRSKASDGQERGYPSLRRDFPLRRSTLTQHRITRIGATARSREQVADAATNLATYQKRFSRFLLYGDVRQRQTHEDAHEVVRKMHAV